jgi:propionate CoA-transferase
MAGFADGEALLTKLMDVEQVVDQISDGCTLAFPGNLTIMVVDELLKGLEERFSRTGRPRGLTVFEPCNATLGPGTGIERLAHEGLLRKLICSAFPTFKGGRLAAMIESNSIEAYNLPMGVLYSLTREIGAGRPGLLTRVGLGTFVDPERSGGKLNSVTTEDMVERIKLNGTEFLFYRAFPIDVVFLKATEADAKGNLGFAREPLSLGALSLAIAARTSRGRVFAQVERVVAEGSIPPKSVLVPGSFVDGFVLAPNAPQSGVSQFDPTITGESRAELGRAPCRTDPRASFSRGPRPCSGRVGWSIWASAFPRRFPRCCAKAGWKAKSRSRPSTARSEAFPYSRPRSALMPIQMLCSTRRTHSTFIRAGAWTSPSSASRKPTAPGTST